MTPDDVKKTEPGAPAGQTAQSLTYRARSSAGTCMVTYNFSDGKLSSATCEIRQPKMDPSLYYKCFEGLTLYLCKCRGIPALEDYRWTKDTFKNDRSRWGQCLADGSLICRLEWNSPVSRITLTGGVSSGTFVSTVSYRK
jgi:hypothetical protein